MVLFRILSSRNAASPISNNNKGLLIRIVFRTGRKHCQYLAKEYTELVAIKMLMVFFHELFQKVMFLVIVFSYVDIQMLMELLVIMIGMFQVE